MSEKRWRANFISQTVDEIEIVSETHSYVDVKYPPRGAWAATIRREAKETSYSVICKTPRDAWLDILDYARDAREQASIEFDRWSAVYDKISAKLTSIDAQQTDGT